MAENTKTAGYDIKVIGRHVQVTDAMKNYAIEKVSKIERFQNRILEVIITLDVQKLLHIVDIVVKVNHTKIKSHYTGDNMYASIDLAVDKLQRQLSRYKSRIQDHHATSRQVVDMRVNVFKAPDEVNLADVNDQIEEENQRKMVENFRPHEVVSRETLPLKTLNLDEAIWQLELSGDPFMIFKSEETQKIKVIYRREEDGNFGVVEPEV
jgi:ribosome hibernation promoting factor